MNRKWKPRNRNSHPGTINPFTATGDETRPYFRELPKDWMNHKHMNVPDKNGRFPIEEGLKDMLSDLAKKGFFEVEEPVKKERGNINGKLFEKPVEKEIDPDALEDILDES